MSLPRKIVRVALAAGLANAVAVTGPRRVVLFGGIVRSGDLLLARLKQRFHEALLRQEG